MVFGYEWDINLEASKKHLVNWMGANQKILWDIYIYIYLGKFHHDLTGNHG